MVLYNCTTNAYSIPLACERACNFIAPKLQDVGGTKYSLRTSDVSKIITITNITCIFVYVMGGGGGGGEEKIVMFRSMPESSHLRQVSTLKLFHNHDTCISQPEV